ncbi:MAG: hypothetical protein ABI868_05385 [Acidobacteriota bacterium]
MMQPDPAHERAAEALRASEERLRDLVEPAQDLIYCGDGRGRFSYVNTVGADLAAGVIPAPRPAGRVMRGARQPR